MNRISFFTKIIALFVALSTLSTPLIAMRKSGSKSRFSKYTDIIDHNLRTNISKAKEHNRHYVDSTPDIIAPHSDVLDQVITYCYAYDANPEKALQKSIYIFLKLGIVCKDFRAKFNYSYIAKLCGDEKYNLATRTALFKKLTEPTYEPGYPNVQLKALILLSAGIESLKPTPENKQIYADNLLIEGIKSNNIDLVTALFKHEVSPNGHDMRGPIFFHVNTLAMGKLFIANKVNKEISEQFPQLNVLWKVINQHYPPELLEFYLEQGINARQLHPYDNSCLLHKLTHVSPINDDFFKKVTLLLRAIPDMINTIDKNGKTPLDLIRSSEELKELFKKNGGKTAQEWEEDTNLDMQDELGQTALIRATKRNDFQRVAELLALGADANIQDKQRKKAVHYANFIPMIKLLAPYTYCKGEDTCLICGCVHLDMRADQWVNGRTGYLCLECYERRPIVYPNDSKYRSVLSISKGIVQKSLTT